MKKSIMLLLPVFFLFSAKVHSLELYKDQAVVSYYAEKFHGRKTANGEIFNMYAMTCAHKTLPFNTVIRVTNLANGKSVDVRVNDRGPFVAGREADLSKGAASKLGMIKTGTAKVKIHIVKMGANTKQSAVSAKKAQKIPLEKSKDTQTSSSSAKKIQVKKGVLYDVQLASFSDEKNAKDFAKKVAGKKIKNVAIQKSDGKARVAVIKVDGADVADVMKKLAENGYSNVLVRERK